jgi:nitrite reductase/ring-hydroxylating ferredoxin subunit
MMTTMKRSSSLVTISRREFCAVVGLATAAGVVIGCSSNGSPQSPDASVPPPDASGSGSGTCGTGTDVGAPTAFVLNTPKYFATGNFFVVRDSGGLFAVSARCTHQGVTVAVSGTEYRCPAHGATFMFNGTVTGGPTSTSLSHFSMCLLSNGHVGVAAGTTVPAATRLMA